MVEYYNTALLYPWKLSFGMGADHLAQKLENNTRQHIIKYSAGVMESNDSNNLDINCIFQKGVVQEPFKL